MTAALAVGRERAARRPDDDLRRAGADALRSAEQHLRLTEVANRPNGNLALRNRRRPGSSPSSTSARSRGARRRGRRAHLAHTTDELAESVRARGLGEARVFGSVGEMADHVDVIAIFSPNFTRIETFEADRRRGRRWGAAARVDLREAARTEPGRGPAGHRARRTRSVCRPRTSRTRSTWRCSSTRGRNSPGSARRWVRSRLPVPVRSTRARTTPGSGIHACRAVACLSDMGCHCLAVGWYLLTPGRPRPALPRPADRLRRRRPAQVGPAALARRAARALRRRLRDDPGRGLRHRPRHVPRSRDGTAIEGAVHRFVDVRQAGLAAARRRDRPRLRPRGEQPALTARDLHRRRRRRRRRRRGAGAGEGDRVTRACSRSSRTNPTSTATPTRTSTRSPRSARAAPRCSTSSTASRSSASRWPRTSRPRKAE